jgi:hypothetical protein
MATRETAVIGLNLLNEPAPERESGRNTFWLGSQTGWHQIVDSQVPVILDAGL